MGEEHLKRTHTKMRDVQSFAFLKFSDCFKRAGLLWILLQRLKVDFFAFKHPVSCFNFPSPPLLLCLLVLGPFLLADHQTQQPPLDHSTNSEGREEEGKREKKGGKIQAIFSLSLSW